MDYDLRNFTMSYKSTAKLINDRILTDYFIRLMLIARSLFKYENLPNGLDEKWIERYLFCEGACLFYKDPNFGYMVAKIGETGPLNYYDEPTSVRPYATNYIYEGKELINNENCVIIRNNDEMLPTAPTLQIYAYDLTNLKRTQDTNIMSLKMPTIIRCSDKQKLSLKQTILQRNDNEPVIWADKNLDLNNVEVLDLKTTIVFDKLQIQKHAIWNECMTFLGINNANMDKRERLVDDEVQANNEQVKACEDVMLKAREEAVKRINEMFGLNIQVRRRNLSEMPSIRLEDDINFDDIEEGDK